MRLFGREDSAGSDPLARIIAQIDEPVQRRALVQVTPAGSGRSWWGIILLTEENVHLAFGESTHWLAQLGRPRSPEQHLLSVPLAEIVRVELPPRGGFVRRILSGPTRIALIHRRDGDRIALEVDDDGAAVVEEAARRAAELRP